MADWPRLLRTLLLEFLTRFLFTLSNPGSHNTLSSVVATTVIQNVISELLMPLQRSSFLSLALLNGLQISHIQLSLQLTQIPSAFGVPVSGSANETNDNNPDWPGFPLSFGDQILWNKLIAAFGQEQVSALPRNHLTGRQCYSATFPYIVFEPLKNDEDTDIATAQQSCRAFCENEMMQYSMQLSIELRQPVAPYRSKCVQDQSFAFEVQESIYHPAGASCAISAAENRGQCPYAPSTCACRVVVLLKSILKTKIQRGNGGWEFYLSPYVNHAMLTNGPIREYIFRSSHECALNEMADRLQPSTSDSTVWLRGPSEPMVTENSIQCRSSNTRCVCDKAKNVNNERLPRPWLCKEHPWRDRIEQCPVIYSSQTHGTGHSQWPSSSNSQNQWRQSTRGSTQEFGDATLQPDPFPEFTKSPEEMSQFFQAYQELCEAPHPTEESSSNPSSQPGANIGQCWPIPPLDYGYISAAYGGELLALASDPNARPAYDPGFFPTTNANTLTSARPDPNADAPPNPSSLRYPSRVRTAADEAAYDDFYGRNKRPASWR